MKMRQLIPGLVLLALLGLLRHTAASQSLPYSPNAASPDVPGPDASLLALNSTVLNPPGVDRFDYTRPNQKTRIDNFVFDAFGPYPLLGSALAAGVNQFNNSPPEWHQGVEGYSKRWSSDYGIVAVATTTRYGLAQALKEDTLYYRCDCIGVFPRARHALFSTLTARRGHDGHRVFSLPALIGPYAGTMTAVYGWYPNRFGAKDAFRMGSYSLLAYAGSNLSLEFLYSGPHSLLTRMHMNNPHAAPDPGPNHASEAGSLH
jgi:hypothetical protein